MFLDGSLGFFIVNFVERRRKRREVSWLVYSWGWGWVGLVVVFIGLLFV